MRQTGTGPPVTRSNLFDPLRLLLALLVAFEHSFLIFGGNAASPFGFQHMSLNYFAVNGFFIVSGFLVTDSMLKRGKLMTFIGSRLLRIYPALIGLVIVTACLIGPALTSLPLQSYFTSPQLLDYAAQILTFRDADPPLPGVTFDTYKPESLSIVLWTLRYEMIAYGLTVLLFLSGILHRVGVITLLTTLVIIAFGIELQFGLFSDRAEALMPLLRFASCYLIGAVLVQSPGWRSYAAPLSLLFLLMGLTLNTVQSPLAEIALNTALAYGLLAMATITAGWITSPFRGMDDISYGLYIWHWPVFQLVGHLFPQGGSAGVLFLGLPLSVCLAWLSWRVAERPALRLKRRRTAKTPALQPNP